MFWWIWYIVNEVAKSIEITQETHLQIFQTEDDKFLEGIKLLIFFLFLLVMN